MNQELAAAVFDGLFLIGGVACAVVVVLGLVALVGRMVSKR